MGPNNDLWDSDAEQPAAGAAGGAAASAARATSDEDAVATSDDDGGGGAAAAGATSSKVKLLVCEWCGLTSKDRDLFPGKQNNETTTKTKRMPARGPTKQTISGTAIHHAREVC